MGPRKEAKDSRKICERGVPGNFYLAQPPCTYIYHKNHPNVGKYTIHVWNESPFHSPNNPFKLLQFLCLFHRSKKIQAIAALLKLGLKKYWSQGIRKFIPCKKGQNILSKQSELYTTVFIYIVLMFWLFWYVFCPFWFFGIFWNIIMFQDFRSWGTTVFFSKNWKLYASFIFTLLGDIWHHQLVFHRALIWSFTPSVDESILEMDGNGEFVEDKYVSEMAGFLSPIYAHSLGSCPNSCHTTNSRATPVCPLFLIILLLSLILENMRLYVLKVCVPTVFQKFKRSRWEVGKSRVWCMTMAIHIQLALAVFDGWMMVEICDVSRCAEWI